MDQVVAYLPSLIRGAMLTVEVAVWSFCIAILLGLLGALAKTSNFPVMRRMGAGYTTLIRGVPELVLMLLVFYGSQIALNHLGLKYSFSPPLIEPLLAGIVTLGFIFGAYFTETFRGAYLAVPRGQAEAGLAVGMTAPAVFVRLILPQLVRHALPGVANNWLVLLKATAIVSIIGLEDMTRIADQAGRTTGQPFTFYMVVCAVYLALTALSEVLLHVVRSRSSRGHQRNTASHA